MKKIVWKWAKKYQIHILVWSIFIFYETVVIGMITGYFGNLLTYILHYGINISIFYLNAVLLMPWAVNLRKFSKFRLPMVLFAQIVFYALISFLADKGLAIIGIIKDLDLDQQFVLRALYRGVYFLGFSTGYFFIVNYLRERRITEKLKREKLKDLINQHEIRRELSKTQNAFLKAQINPHFLFNTLDFIYHSTLSKPENAAEAVIILSKMMRFAINADHQGEYILLHHELEQVGNLIDLYQLRSSYRLNINFEYHPDVSELYIIPLLLLTLVENIFKHGDTRSSHLALISIEIEDDLLIIRTNNVINSRISTVKGHMGLTNLKKRLEYAYGEDQYFNFRQIDDLFDLVIKIKLERMEINLINHPA